MTEAVILALIALAGLTAFTTTAVILVGMVLKAAPAHFKFQTEHGLVEVDFDHEADE